MVLCIAVAVCWLIVLLRVILCCIGVAVWLRCALLGLGGLCINYLLSLWVVTVADLLLPRVVFVSWSYVFADLLNVVGLLVCGVVAVTFAFGAMFVGCAFICAFNDLVLCLFCSWFVLV